LKITIIAGVSALVLAAGNAGAATVVVPGTADPFLAGAPAGAYVIFGPGDEDTAPAESPVGVAVTPGETVTISDVTGTVSNGPCCAALGPTGGAPISLTKFGVHGFTELLVPHYENPLPIDSLIGVFYGPNRLDPGVDRVFEIGAGGSFVVPTGTTELYLATVDGEQWNDNTGAFTASVSVPEPAAWAMMLLGFGGIGTALRSRRRPSGLAATA
jgi:hypothetical protein